MKLSIITVNFNNDMGLKKTILSLRNQSFKNFEFIVVDGGSNDNSLKIIKDNLDLITKYISEKDNGIYDAMNKGIDFASGDYILFLNSGDILYNNDTLYHVMSILSKRKDNKVYFGRAKNIKNNISWLYPSQHIKESNIDNWLKNNEPNHQAMFFPKKFYKSDKYNLNLKIMADADYKLRAIEECGYFFIDEILVVFELGGVSSNPSNIKRILIQIHDRIYVDIKYKKKYITIFITPLKFFAKYILNKIGYERYIKILKILKGYK